MLKLQKFIEENNNWEEKLTMEPYYLIIKRQNINEEKDYILFKYDQINSDFSEEIVQEARGIIFEINNVTNNIKPVCVPFFKFFNLGEKYAARLHEKSITFLEKKDGSLIKLWFNLDEWHWSTNGTIDAKNAKFTEEEDIQMGNTFFDLIEKSKEYFYIKEMIQNNLLDENLTYMFELTSSQAKIVVPYEGTHLTFLSARNNSTLIEQDYNFGEYERKIPRPLKYDILSLSAAKNVVDHFPFKKEGLVAVDKNYNRVKIKSPAYLAVSYLRLNGDVTKSRIIDIIKKGESKEFLNYYPEYIEMFEKIEKELQAYKNMIKDIITDMCLNNITNGRQIYERYKNKTIEERKIANAWIRQDLYTKWLYDFTAEQISEKIEKYTKEKENDNQQNLGNAQQ